MKVVILSKESQDLISEIKKEVYLEDEQVILCALLCYKKNIERVRQEMELLIDKPNDKPNNKSFDKSFWEFWKNIYEKCAELKRLEEK